MHNYFFYYVVQSVPINQSKDSYEWKWKPHHDSITTGQFTWDMYITQHTNAEIQSNQRNCWMKKIMNEICMYPQKTIYLYFSSTYQSTTEQGLTKSTRINDHFQNTKWNSNTNQSLHSVHSMFDKTYKI